MVNQEDKVEDCGLIGKLICDFKCSERIKRLKKAVAIGQPFFIHTLKFIIENCITFYGNIPSSV